MKYFSLFLILPLLLFISCNSIKQNKRGVKLSMKKYDALILKFNADDLSKMFAENANLGNIVFGRDSIKTFFEGFSNIKVISQFSTSDCVEVSGDSAFQNGTYRQTDLILKDTLRVTGTYKAKWKWDKNKGWLIQEMITKSIN